MNMTKEEKKEIYLKSMAAIDKMQELGAMQIAIMKHVVMVCEIVKRREKNEK